MATIRYYTRRLRRAASNTAVQLLAIGLFLWFGISWVIENNHLDDQPHTPVARPTTSVDGESVDWSSKYYVQYATTPEYLCNALMIWSEIEDIGSRAQRIMLYPDSWDATEIDDITPSLDLAPTARLLQQAATDYFVTLRPVPVLHHNTTQSTWADSFTKLLAFNLTEFERILYLDSDAMVLQNMDELFLLQEAPLAMPWVYWGASQGYSYSSQLMLITPSATLFKKIEAAIEKAGPDEYDMDILNSLLPRSQILHLPARPYNLLSGEFRRRTHQQYLSSTPSRKHRKDPWDPHYMLSEAKFLHFSDWPVPKPWMRASKEMLNKYMPKCVRTTSFGATDCRDRTVWLQLYYDFAVRRKRVCGPGFELQEAVLPPNSKLVNGKWVHPDELSK